MLNGHLDVVGVEGYDDPFHLRVDNDAGRWFGQRRA